MLHPPMPPVQDTNQWHSLECPSLISLGKTLVFLQNSLYKIKTELSTAWWQLPYSYAMLDQVYYDFEFEKLVWYKIVCIQANQSLLNKKTTQKNRYQNPLVFLMFCIKLFQKNVILIELGILPKMNFGFQNP